MIISRQPLSKTLHHKRLANSTGAIAGFVSALSVLIGVLAARAAPKGLARLSVALHIAKKPLIVKLAPLIAAAAVVFAVAAGLIRFYSWCVEREADETKLPE
jgi:Zn-dependent protease with chaperone function